MKCYRRGWPNHISTNCTYETDIDGATLPEKRKDVTFQPNYVPTSTATSHQVSAEEFDFEDELDQDEMVQGCQFVQHISPSLSPTYVEDMRGNTKYCLNVKDVNGRINMIWILLDNQSIVHIFWNVMFLVNIQDQQTVWASYQH